MIRKTEKETAKETTTDVTFGKVICNAKHTVRTQEIEKTAPSWHMVEECLWDMFEDADEFVVLTVGDARYHIRFIQAAQIAEGITVQLGIEEGEHTRLVEKTCSEDECMEIFQRFYDSSQVQDVERYTPVEFYR